MGDGSHGATLWVSAGFPGLSVQHLLQPPKVGSVGKAGCRGGGRRCPPTYTYHLLLRAKTDSAEAAGASWPGSRALLEGTAHSRTHRACFAKAALIAAALLPSSCTVSARGWWSSPLQGTVTALLVLCSPQAVKCKQKKKTKKNQKWFGVFFPLWAENRPFYLPYVRVEILRLSLLFRSELLMVGGIYTCMVG